MIKLKCWCFLLIMATPLQMLAQPEEIDPPPGLLAKEFAHNLYLTEIGRQSELYTGNEYNPGRTVRKGHPFYQSMQWVSAFIKFDGITYKDIELNYDIHQDLLLVKTFSEAGRMATMVPDQDQVQAFGYEGQYFINAKVLDTLALPHGLEGFYRVEYDHNLTVLTKLNKNIVSSGSANSEYVMKQLVFLLKDGEVNRIRGKGSLLSQLRDRKKELRRYIKSSRLFFFQDPSGFVRYVSTYYDQLNSGK